ncbi:MAG: threonine synthase [Clostridiales bacterium]|jgi:threonine synthase|nr:threonine synthase [Clostridiales bacterium]
MKNVKSAECIMCKTQIKASPNITVCPECGGILEIVYDYEWIGKNTSIEKIKKDPDRSMWRYREFLPVEETSAVSGLRAGGTPLYSAGRLGNLLGYSRLFIKDDGLNPTGSLKDRPSALAVVKAAEAGISSIACSSTGNAASSLAGSAAAAGLSSYIFVPKRAPAAKVAQLLIFGAHVISVQGSYEDAFRLSSEAISRWGWYNRNAAINPYLSEGKKTVSFEIAEQLGFSAPDFVAASVGDGCTIAGIWKGFKDLFAAGFINKLPRLISVQASGCRPINRAFEAGNEILEPADENTIADSIAVGIPRNFHKAVRALRESNGITANVSDEDMLHAMALAGKTTGVFGEPAGMASIAGLMKLAGKGIIPKDSLIVSVVTGNGLKDIKSASKAVREPIKCNPDMESLLAAFEADEGMR